MVSLLANSRHQKNDDYAQALRGSIEPEKAIEAMWRLAKDNKFQELGDLAKSWLSRSHETLAESDKKNFKLMGAAALNILASSADKNEKAASEIFGCRAISYKLLASDHDSAPQLVRYMAKADQLPRELAVSLHQKLTKIDPSDALMLAGTIARLPVQTPADLEQSSNAARSLSYGSFHTAEQRAELLMSIHSSLNTDHRVKALAIEFLANADLRRFPQILEKSELSGELMAAFLKKVNEGGSPLSLATMVAREDTDLKGSIANAAYGLTEVLSSPGSAAWTKWGAASFESIKMVAKSSSLEREQQVKLVGTLAHAINKDPRGVVATALELIENRDMRPNKTAVISDQVKYAAIAILGEVLRARVLDKSTSLAVETHLKEIAQTDRSYLGLAAREALSQREISKRIGSFCYDVGKAVYNFFK